METYPRNNIVNSILSTLACALCLLAGQVLNAGGLRKIIAIVALTFLSTTAVAIPNIRACFHLFGGKNAISNDLKRSEVLKQSGITHLTHATTIESAISIFSNKAFKSARSLGLDADMSPTRSYVYLSWTGKDIKAYEITSTADYQKADNLKGAKILLPISYIDSPQFDHFSNSFRYGLGREFTKENFASGMRDKVNESVEVAFQDQVQIKIEDAKLIVYPKYRDEVIQKLSEINPNVDWQKIVLKVKDRYENPLAITTAELSELQVPQIWYDIHILNPSRALDLAREYVLLNVGKNKQFNTLSTFNSLAQWIYALGDFKSYINLVLVAKNSKTPEGEEVFDNFVRLARLAMRFNDSNFNERAFMEPLLSKEERLRFFSHQERLRFVNNVKEWLKSTDANTQQIMLKYYLKEYRQVLSE